MKKNDFLKKIIASFEGLGCDYYKKEKYVQITLTSFLILVLVGTRTLAMHIMEGYLPKGWAGFWTLVFVPFFVFGLRKIQTIIRKEPEKKLLLALCGAFVFILSALKIPSVTGSCSHPTGVGLGAIIFGPSVMSVLGALVLLFQAILLAHGGITTLGANAFSMAIVGPITSYLIYKALIKISNSNRIPVFFAAALGNIVTYAITSLQLALAFPDPSGGIMASILKFFGVFLLTQVPIAIAEGIFTVIVFNLISDRAMIKEEKLHAR